MTELERLAWSGIHGAPNTTRCRCGHHRDDHEGVRAGVSGWTSSGGCRRCSCPHLNIKRWATAEQAEAAWEREQEANNAKR